VGVGALRKAIHAGVLSALLPGAGQLYLGHKRRGLLFVALALLPLVFLGTMLARAGASIVSVVLRPSVLGALLVGNGAVAAFRLFAVFDAYQLGRDEETSRPPAWARVPISCAAMLTLAAVTLVPHAIAGYYNAQVYQTVTLIFGGGGVGGDLTSQLPGWSDTRANGAPRQRTWSGRLTVLLLGGDAGAGRVGLRTDTMIIASLDPATRHMALIGLPRNLTSVPLTGRAAAFPCRCFPGLLNALYRYATEVKPQDFPDGPDRGAMAVTRAAENLTGLKIDYYALVDLEGFVGVVNTLGGVDVRVTEHVKDRVSSPVGDGHLGPNVNVGPGSHHFNGSQALAYVRSRSADDDYHRMRRQRCLLAGLASQANMPSLLRALPHLLQIARRSVSTNIPAAELPGLASLATRIRGAQVTTLGLDPPRYSGRDAKDHQIPKIAKIRAGVQLALHPADGPATAQDSAVVQGGSCV
jgi:polyisoprenyl-teichoic acid--peptidoglycan teichoic acid transferase